ncbi:MAG: glycosyltransferase [Fuerstiella sp.]|nr:glycosyltransferase [Fuerstiella sp.]MCP4858488.1 glycosyltransferase [Fuerstiella sp.]
MLAGRLLQSEIEVSVIALNRGGFYAQELKRAGVHVDVLKKRFRFDPLTYFRLRRRLHQLQPDIIQSFLFSANSYVRLPGIAPKSSRIIVSERCVDSWKSGWQLRTDRWLSGRMLAMTANSESVADFYATKAGVPHNLITVIPNGQPLPSAVAARPAGPTLREEVGLPADARVIGFVGRLAPQKCLSDLVWAIQLLYQVIDNVYLVLVGKGPVRDQLAELAQSFGCRDRIIFLGHRTDAASLTRQFDVFCLPSSFEGMSNSMMEAMASAVPVVASDIPSNRELVEHEQTGLLFNHGDGAAIMMALKRVLESAELAERLGTAGFNLIAERHSIEQMVQRHVDLYQDVCS